MMMVLILSYTLVAAVGFLTPLHQKNQLDQLARQMMYEINLTGGLTDEERGEMTLKFEKMGLEGVRIDCPYPVQLMRRQSGNFQVEGYLTFQIVDGLFTMRNHKYQYRFDGMVYEKKVIN